jgi:cytochrome c oxidase cbb3-type subunit 3
MSQELRKDAIQGQIIHIYDGIEEADNELPRWWLVTFFGAIVFAIFYWMAFESVPVADYPGAAFTKARLEAMNKGGVVTNQDIMALVEDAPMVAAGKATFIRTCSKCHGAKAEGKEGPNLTDNFWLYGGNPTEIFHTISTGTKKGMPDWGPKLGSGAVKQVAAYIITLRNTNVPGKAAQGDEWVPAPEEEAAPEGEAGAEAKVPPAESAP